MAADARSFAAWLPSPAHQMIKLDSEALTDLRFWVELRGFEPLTPSMRKSLPLWLHVAQGRSAPGQTYRLNACARLVWPEVGGRWLPTWLPQPRSRDHD